jgi:transposase
MRQSHVAGKRMFVDYAGTTLEVVDGTTGEVRVCQLLVATLGASKYTYAEAIFTQRLVDWIGSHVRAFAFFGGVAAQIVSDNREMIGDEPIPNSEGCESSLGDPGYCPYCAET